MGAYGRHETRSGRSAVRRTAGGQRKQDPGPERLGGIQLAVCLALFLAVFVGKAVLPGGLAGTGDRFLSVLQTDTDFRGALAGLGEALAGQGPVLGELGEFCLAVFGPARDEPAQSVVTVPDTLTARSLSAEGDQAQMLQYYLRREDLPAGWELQPAVSAMAPVESGGEDRDLPALEVGAVLQAGSFEEEPPERYSADWLYLGELETVTPVQGGVTSGFGYRNHPIKGKYAFHGGVDIGAAIGTPVAAYADGVVEYIGKSDDFGLYLQIVHENEVKTFYAHCSKLLVSKGQQVKAGETVALVGDTGQVTGPHLHFEIKWNGTGLDPLYYLDLNGGT